MPVERFEASIEAERFIHNDLAGCAFGFLEAMRQKFAADNTEGVYFDMMGSLVFAAFAIEAKVNFIGWKVLEDGWPERANLREKVDLLRKILPIELSWGERPLQTLGKLKKFRDTLAHGKPEIIDRTIITDVEPRIWEVLEGQWEASVTPDFVERCNADLDALWHALLAASEISVAQTLTHGGHSLRSIVEPDPRD